jgi:tRNA G18 (ribose-2'-O)-methylase SpoU
MPAGTRRNDLVVVASLIDRVPNLAGLTRTAEVLGAAALVLSDLRVTGEGLFTG